MTPFATETAPYYERESAAFCDLTKAMAEWRLAQELLANQLRHVVPPSNLAAFRAKRYEALGLEVIRHPLHPANHDRP